MSRQRSAQGEYLCVAAAAIGACGGYRAEWRDAAELYAVRSGLGDDPPNAQQKKAERRAAIDAALVGEKFPATATIDSEVYLLDRAGLDRPPTPRGSALAAWDGWDYDNNCALVEDAETMPALPERQYATLRRAPRPRPTTRPNDAVWCMKFVDAQSARIGWLAVMDT